MHCLRYVRIYRRAFWWREVEVKELGSIPGESRGCPRSRCTGSNLTHIITCHASATKLLLFQQKKEHESTALDYIG